MGYKMKDEELLRLRNENKVLLKLLLLSSHYISNISSDSVIMPYERDDIIKYIDDEISKNKISHWKI